MSPGEPPGRTGDPAATLGRGIPPGKDRARPMSLRRMVYALASLPVRLAVKVFFRRVELAGEENLPAGPVVLAANHPNMLLDPLLVAVAVYPRKVNFLAKAPLFSIPIVGTVFRTLGVLPVYRKQDFPDQMGQNQSMFQACVDALHRGESIGIFPEGVSASDPRLQPLKTGAARILLEAAADAPPGREPALLPVGLNYGDRTVFRSDVLIVVGPPLDPAPYAGRWAEDPRGAARALTDALEESLEGVLRNLARVEDERVVARLERLYRTELIPVGDDLEERFWLSRSIVDGFEYFRRVEPEKVAAVEARLDQYFFGLDSFDLSGAQLRQGIDGYTFGNVARFLLRVVPPLLVTAPLALHGFLGNFLPYNLTDPLARRGGVGPEELATNKVLWGTVLFALFYLLETAWVAHACGNLYALLHLVSLPGTGFVALWWLDQARYLARHARTAGIFVRRSGFRERMERMRQELLDDLQELADRYLHLREKGELVTEAAPATGEEASG